MEEPNFPFYIEGDEDEVPHCHDCGKPLPDAGDPGVIYVLGQAGDGSFVRLPVCRLHWHERTDWRQRSKAS
jgi:hypothetical protein